MGYEYESTVKLPKRILYGKLKVELNMSESKENDIYISMYMYVIYV